MRFILFYFILPLFHQEILIEIEHLFFKGVVAKRQQKKNYYYPVWPTISMRKIALM